jgi:hypothetical protein
VRIALRYVLKSPTCDTAAILLCAGSSVNLFSSWAAPAV